MPATGTMQPATRQMAVRRARMGLLFACAGLLWMMLALVSLHRFTPRTLTFGSMLGASALVASLALLRRAPRLPRDPLPLAEVARIRRILVAVNILEWVAVATATGVLLLLHLPEYILTAAGIIVGLYLYPLAGALRAPLHTVTATVLVSWNAACLGLLPRERHSGTGALGTGSILLVSSAITLGWALWRTRGVAQSLTPPEPVNLPIH